MSETAATIKYSKETYVGWYKSMYLQRKFEERAGQLYGQQKIRGFCHLYIGQEAVSAGMISATNQDDPIITAYRDHGLALAKGISANACMAELYGKATGCAKGKGGSMHFFSKEHHFYGGHGIVGAQIPLGAGIAFAEKYKGTDKVCLTLFGDGAARQGALHETFNLAMLWDLPVIFICENNYYAMGTSVSRSSNVTELYQLGAGYSMPSEPVDGMSVEAVHEAIEKAAAHCRSGKGPYFLEIRTYRYKGHSMSDPQKYRTKEEVKEYKSIDPVKDVKRIILEQNWMSEQEVKDLEGKIKKEVEDSIKFAEESPWPDNQELWKDNYVQPDYPFITD